MTLVLAVLAAGVTALLLVAPHGNATPEPVRGAPDEVEGARAPGVLLRRPTVGMAAVGAVGVGALVVTVQGTVLALGVIGVLATVGGAGLVIRSRRRRAAAQRAESVVEVCEALAGELRAGQPPLTALRRSVEVWPELEPVARAGELGADVPSALRRLARLPGAAGLRDVAAAWQVSQSSGATMAVAFARVGEAARRRRATERLVAGELASAQATARLVAGLPVAVLAMGAGLGGDPWGFLLRTGPGLACLGAGLALTMTGLAWIERLATAAVDR